MDQFDYPLPPGAIAQEPIEPRHAARLLDATDRTGDLHHRRVLELPDLLGAGDVLVVNETKVLAARLRLEKASGGAVEVLLLEPTGADSGEHAWQALVKPGKRVGPGTVLLAGGIKAVEVGEPLEGGRRLVRILDQAAVDGAGVVPLPPYIKQPLADPDRYQTVYARLPGSVAAPTAGLHLSTDVLERCRARGVTIASVDLTVGLDTFRPITVDDPADHVMHSEAYSVPEATLAACHAAERVVAVGTTTVRALESAARGALAGRTSLFISEGFQFNVVDVLLTNFHMPRSSLLLLVAAFTGPRWRDVYEVALTEKYRFLSFGDCMLLGRHDR